MRYGEGRRSAGAGLFVCWVLVSCAGGDGGGVAGTSIDGAEPSATSTVLAPVVIGAPPVGLVFDGSPADQAVAIMDALAVDGPERVAAAIGAFAAAGLPVVAGDGVSVTTDPTDVVGLPWPVVWLAAQSRSGVDVVGEMRLFGLAVTGDGDLARDVAEATVAGLQGALADPDPQVQLLAMVVAESARQSRDVELSSVVPGGALFVDQVVAAMVLAAAERGVMGSLLELAAVAEGTVGSSVPEGLMASQRAGLDASDCSSTEANYVAYVVSKVSGGLGGVGNLGKTGGWFQKAANGVLAAGYEKLGGVALSEIMGKMMGVVGAGMNVGAFAAALGNRQATAALDPAKLSRTKSTTKDGDPGGVTFTIKSELSLDAANCVLLILSAMGNNTLFQSDGAMAGVEVMIEGREGFDGQGDFMYFGGDIDSAPGKPMQARVKGDTGSTGAVRFAVQGRAQVREIPLTAPPYQRTFSIFAEAALSPTDGVAILKTALDSMLCASAVGTGCADAAADIASQFHWDLGDFDFKITDWQTALFANITIHYHGIDVSTVWQDPLVPHELTDLTFQAKHVEVKLGGASDPLTWTATVPLTLLDASTTDCAWPGTPFKSVVTVTLTGHLEPKPSTASGATPPDVSMTAALGGPDYGGYYSYDATEGHPECANGFDQVGHLELGSEWVGAGGLEPFIVPFTGGSLTKMFSGVGDWGGTVEITATIELSAT